MVGIFKVFAKLIDVMTLDKFHEMLKVKYNISNE